MRTAGLFLSACLAATGLLVPNAHAATSVKIVDTWPRGEEVVLGRNQDFYVRLAYATDQPTLIWARPYFQGRPANAGSNPSREYSGTGETFGWFFLMKPDVQVDEIRITAGDGSLAHTPLVADLRIHVSGSDRVWDQHDDPAWVATMKASEAEAQRKDYETRMNAPIRPGAALLSAGFILAVCATAIFSLGLPAWGLWKWHGGWRMAAAIPLAVMAFVVLRIFVDTARDPTSHNLWPFEILMFGVPCALTMLALLMVRRIRMGRRPGKGDVAN